MLRKKVLMLVTLTLVSLLISTSMAQAATKRMSLYRGSALMWSKTTIDFSYASNKITNSATDQSCGWIFPNIVRKDGVTKYVYSTSHHRLTSKYIYGAGVPTPWGDVKVYESVMKDIGHIYGSGSCYWE